MTLIIIKWAEHLFTKWLEVDVEGETVASHLFISFTFGKVKAESQQ